MEPRKKTEIEHYDSHALEWLSKHQNIPGIGGKDFEGFQPLILSSYQYCYQLVARYAQGKKILDFGCGNGVHLPYLASLALSVVGIDLSSPSLDIAKRRIEHLEKKEKITLQQMDCEHLTFPDNSFEVVFDGGTFSSLDFEQALKELSRILTPDGCVIGIETFGHNPLTNLKRLINRKKGKRTAWATDHILKNASLARAKKYFENVDVHYFHILSSFALPLLGKKGGKIILKTLEMFDSLLLLIPFFRTYAFKIVFVFSKPLKTKT